jgi:uncharacterized repeat protein (TIGR03803 family)
LRAALVAGALTACAHATGAPPIPAAPSVARSIPEGRQPASAGYKSLYSFGKKSQDGFAPLANLIGQGGKLYGTTQYGGRTTAQCYLGCGTVFSVTATGTEAVAYRFKGGADGDGPVAGLLWFDGAFYGTTGGGGSGCSGGCGTVFRLDPTGKSENVLYAFKGATDGADPVAGLVAMNGTLYGTTEYGGKLTRLCPQGCGTIFSVSSSGAEKVIYRFKGGADGALPASRLAAIDGALYGTTQYGGSTTALCSTGCGTLFKTTPSGTKNTVYSFKYTPSSGDAAFPAAGVVAMGGDLFGTTVGGGTLGDGTVFAVSESSGAERVVHSFACCVSGSDGQYPYDRLTVSQGVLYGTTRQGGASNVGAIFSVTASGAERVLYSFMGKPDGALPVASLTLFNGVLYGTAASGGASSEGSIFTLATPAP